MNGEFTSGDSQIVGIVSRLKQFGKESLEYRVGISGLNIGLAKRTLVNDLEHYPHAFVLGCIADRRAHADIAWSIPGAIREAAGDFEFETLAELPESVWSSVLETSGHPLATKISAANGATLVVNVSAENAAWGPSAHRAESLERFPV